jgi:hypothetical protein
LSSLQENHSSDVQKISIAKATFLLF